MTHANDTRRFALHTLSWDDRPVPRRAVPRPRWCAALWMGCVLATSLAWSQPPECQINDIRLGFQDRVKTGCWLPITVYLESKGAPFQGSLVLTTPDADGEATNLVIPDLAIESNGQRVVRHFIKLGNAVASVRAQLLDARANHRVVAEATVDLSQAPQPMRVLRANEKFIVMWGSPAGLFEASGETPDEGARAVDPNEQEVASIVTAEDFPTQWIAYSGVDTVVLATRDVRLFDKLSPASASALQTWVRQGGRLVVSVADNWQVVAKSFLAPMLPATLTGQTTLRVPDALEAFDPQIKGRLDNLPIAELTNVKGSVVVRQGDRPLVVTATYGLGVVTLLAFDTDRPPFQNWQGRQDFWIKLLDFQRTTSPSDQVEVRMRQLTSTGVSDLSTVLNNYLEDFPDVTVVPFGWVALLIFGYILLIGPIDYFFLKKVVGRLELTWLTFPTWVVLVSVAAYFGAHWLKGSDLRINRVEVVDIDVDSQTLRGSSFLAVFSPRIARYTLTILPELAAKGSWSQLGMGRDQADRNTTWCGVPEDAVRGVNSSRGGITLFGGRGYQYDQPEAMAVVDVPIKVWSVKTFTSRWLAQADTAVALDLRAGDDFLTGTITNRLDRALTNVIVAYRERIYEIPVLKPGDFVDLAAARARTLSGFLAEMADASPPQPFGVPRVPPDRVIRHLMFAKRTPEASRRYTSGYLRDLDFSDRIELGKVIVFARVEGAGGQLWLNALPDGKAAAPKIPGVMNTQTYLRLVLEPKKEST